MRFIGIGIFDTAAARIISGCCCKDTIHDSLNRITIDVGELQV